MSKRQASRARAAGVALPIALVLLFIVTGLVATQVRRGMVDERLAANTRESVSLDSAAQLVLRWCEAWVIASTGDPSVPRPVTVPAARLGESPPAKAAWRVALNWEDATSNVFTGATLPGGIVFNRCLVEDATDELNGSISTSNQLGGSARDQRFVKYRLTAQVRTSAPGLPPSEPGVPNDMRAAFVQSELRLYR